MMSRGVGSPSDDWRRTGAGLRILHLAFEDHRRPGSGGGSARNAAINARLALRHDVTSLTAGYRGAVTRVEDGVRYEHLGVGRGYWLSLMTYFGLLPWVVSRRSRHYDLVIEEFAAPLSSMSVRWWSSRPTLAVVQWLNAREKAKQYHLPFHWFERLGVRSHRRFIAVSHDLAAELARRNSRARISVIPNGVSPESFQVEVPRGPDVVFLGRLEIAQKGLDLLLDAFALIAHRLEGDLVLAGDGPDRSALERQAVALGIAERVRFVGRVSGRSKLELLAAARIVAMPSRFETFGMVAVEAQACGTPVVAFDIPCLREVVPPVGGRLVGDRSAAAYAADLAAAYSDLTLQRSAETSGREFARAYDWDAIAEDQEAVYRRVVEEETCHV